MKWWARLWAWPRSDDATSLESLLVTTAVIEDMRAEGERLAPLETGGVLVGHTAADGSITITAVVGPGPKARHARTRFTRDGDYAQAEVDRLHHASAGHDDYVGEWHTHPQGGGPSITDRESMEWISGNPLYGRETPILLILEQANPKEWRPHAFRWVDGRLVSVRVRTT